MDAETIKQAIRDCETVDDVERVADEYRDAVRALARSTSQSDRTQAQQIANLKAYRIVTLRGM